MLLKEIIRDITISNGKISGIEEFIEKIESLGIEFLGKKENSVKGTTLNFEINGEDVSVNLRMIGDSFLEKKFKKKIFGEIVEVDYSTNIKEGDSDELGEL